MKTILLSIIVLSLFACNKSDPVVTPKPKDKYFNPADISKLKLDSVPNFWENNNFKINNNYWQYIEYPEENNKGVQYSIRIDGPTNHMAIGISVFETQEKAIAGMKFRINHVASVIIEGTTKSPFPGKWWHSKSQSAIFVNQWNTIVEVLIGAYYYKDFEKELMETADEITKRVDKLSSVIE